MSQFNTITDVEAEYVRLLLEGDVETAIRLTADALSHSDSRIKQLFEARDADGLQAEAAIFGRLSRMQIEALRRGGFVAEAFSCAVATLLSVEIYRCGNAVDPLTRVMLYYAAIQSFIDAIERSATPETEQSEEHRGYILSFLASLLYYAYGNAVKAEPDGAGLADVYGFLKSIAQSGAIQSPVIKLNGIDVDPATPGPLLVDIMSRAAALGIYS